ncbi:MAG: hypothetical protein HY906_05805 [Deltaproteobacteria bacterium]|nr:hypothetical protein [Deltaproteobacteria bacterium]
MRANHALALLALLLALPAGCGGPGHPSNDAGASEEWDPVFPACTPSQAPAVAAAPGTKLALSVYHFNVQYVPGGLKGWKTDPTFDMDNEQVEDAIVTQGLEPIVDMYLRHPGWGADIEMQGYMVEVMAARHPAVLEQLRTLLGAGQVRLMSVHYSDQLFLAYPRADMELSLERNDEALATGCVQAGGSVFTQEGQFGEGLLDLLATQGRTVAALPKNLFGYLHPSAARAPLYTSRGMDVVLAGQGVDQGDVSIRWTFMNDGELAASAIVMGSPANPYFGTLYVADPAVVAAHEQEISDLEGQGYAVTSIEAAVKALRALPAYQTPPELPPILDCDWQPDDTTMLLRWMGDVGLNGDAERDNQVLTTNVRARAAVHAARVLVAHARSAGQDVTAAERDLAYAVRHLLWAEVSDASGWNPIANEVQYGLGHAARAIELCDGIAGGLMAALAMTHVEVDLATGGVTPLDALPQEPTGDPVAAPLAVTVTTSRPYTTTWTQLGPGHYRVVVAFETAPAGKAGVAAVTFPALADTVAYSPALLDDQVVSYARTEFAADVTLALPLANGLIGLGNDRWLLKDLHTIHLAAVLQPGAAGVEFHDNTFPGTETGSWAFEVIDGPAAAALARARALNVAPKVRW